MTAPGGSFFEEFIDDFFSECDEHLATVRRVLLDLEAHASGQPNDTDLHELQRALHTLKGLSGMVGLGAAEEIAHAMEDAVRAVQKLEPIPSSVLESLFVGERLLETAVSSRRTNTPPPSPGPYVDRVHELLRAVVADGSSTSSHSMAVASPGATGLDTPRTMRFDFVPSAGLAARGVGVELIRQRLASVGEITATTPRVRDAGGLVFEFVVTLAAGARPDVAWRADGITWDGGDYAFEEDTVRVVVHEGKPVSSAATNTVTNTVSSTISNVVRVDLTRLDDLMRMVGELVVSRARLEASLAKLDDRKSSNTYEDLIEANAQIERQVRTIREGVMRIRLVPIGEVFERMRFAMRDIARDAGKEVRLEFSGQDTEIDKLIVDRMLEPLLHLVRNAASHGIESRDERERAGKPLEGTIWLRARAAGDRIVLEVEDDGAGIDIERLAHRARELGIPSSTASNSPDAMLDLICIPGFSTRDVPDMTSGRGIGMAVVRSTVRSLGGELVVTSEVGRFTRFTIELPLTLMITDALIFEIGSQSMAIPQVSLREIMPLAELEVTRLENNEVVSYRGRVVPLVDLSQVFHLPSTPGAPRHVLIVGNDAHPSGLVVDRVVGLREIVVHPISDPLIAVPGVSGATELADGRVSLILDAAALVRGSRDRGAHGDGRLLRSSDRSIAAPSRAIGERSWA
jgi:two-component system chemotaxis sensor kinase CheA